MTRIERLPSLTPAAAQVLRQRARDRGHDAERRIRHITEALAARRIRAACQFDDSGTPCGFAAWRVWPLDDSLRRAQVIILYTVPEAPPTSGAALVEHVFRDLQLSPTVIMIEARLRDEVPGARAAWLARGCVVFERCHMVHTLDDVMLPATPLPRRYQLIRWKPDHHEGVKAVAQRAHTDNVESVTLPDLWGDLLLRRLRIRVEGEQLGVGDWLPGVSFVALHRSRKVVGYIAIEQAGNQARIVDHAVHPSHRGKGIGRALLLYSLAQCLECNVEAVTVGLSVRNPAFRLYQRAGFAPDSCGDVAIWWEDGRQLAWRE